MNITKPLTAAVLLLGMAATGAHAQTWAKTGTPGNLPGTAQVTQGFGALEEITGVFTFTTTGSERSVRNISDPDLFEIRIDGTSPFSATTLGEPSNIFNPQLFLFDASGYGVYANDDAFSFTTGALISPDFIPAPGLYYIGIAPYGVVARSGDGAGTDIFANTVDDTSGAVTFTGLKTPNAGSGPLTNWFLSSSEVETGYYGIALTGASYAAAPVPEASTLLSFGLPVVCGAVLLLRRRVKQAA